ncbi:patatin-like phospholipase RssA [Leptospira yasudae]|uniref:Patatin-like phospholipase RssA n=1 Tax=Leptospira yasudae TaxID=2202201 RepID=A0A6N4QHT9_9LEPT|nr:patatin-like phospholipase RssA [Leptospira yasudae]TGL77143.1 patatin-like phospholipase RssA [Leptospira yasudae]TGL80442.1 patatin-like phospholipase RssA [Leptospira yasudae]TGL85869.1 patatin-like phospholipase RssA [Leptospira yasudae]
MKKDKNSFQSDLQPANPSLSPQNEAVSKPGRRRKKVGLALGSGSARGWSHIGVIRVLESYGWKPDIICGTSIGSLVGAFYAADKLDRLEEWVQTLEWKDILGFMDISFGGGILRGKKLFDFFEKEFKDLNFDHLTKKYGAVATDIDNGSEIWLREGSVPEAVRASISLPGIFSPVKREDRWLVDGGLVNPVPVSLCKAMGAEFVIAVDLNQDLLDRKEEVEESNAKESNRKSFLSHFWGKDLEENLRKEKDEKPGMIEVMSKSINVMQIRITRSRMAGDPPDVTIAPRLRNIGLMEFHRAQECIEEGKRAAELLAGFLKNPP